MKTTHNIVPRILVPGLIAVTMCLSGCNSASPGDQGIAQTSSTSATSLPSTTSAAETSPPKEPSSTVTSQVIEGITYYTGGIPAEFPQELPLPNGDISMFTYMGDSLGWMISITADPSAFEGEMQRVNSELAQLGYYTWVWGRGLVPLSTTTLSEGSAIFDAVNPTWNYHIQNGELPDGSSGFIVTVDPTLPGDFEPDE